MAPPSPSQATSPPPPSSPPPSADAAQSFLASFDAALIAVDTKQSPPPSSVPSQRPEPRKLTPQRLSSNTTTAATSPFRAAEQIQQEQPKALPDPFARSLPASATFLSPSAFPALPSSAPVPHPPQPAQSPPEPPCNKTALRPAAAFHAACVRALPHLSVTALRSLVDAAVCGNDAAKQLSPPVAGFLKTRAALAKYAIAVLAELRPELSLLPTPVLSAFAGCSHLSLSDALPPSENASFPSVDGRPWSPVELPILCDSSLAALPHRLSVNLEAVWDEVLALQRRFRGDVANVAPGVLDARAALTAMGRLHPAAVDLFAARLLGMVADAALTTRDGDAPEKMRQLGARLRGARGASQMGKGSGGARGQQREKGGGVVLHRLPEVVRSAFADDPMQLFVLDFLTVVDSARLAAALLPRVAAALENKLSAAAAATSNGAFTDAVVDARLFAKLLALTMHAPNWAHSEHALEGADGAAAAKGNTRGLDKQALAARVPVCSSTLAAAFDIAKVLESAMQSGQTLAVVASVAVADVLLRLAAVDPVAGATDWYARAVRSVRAARVCPTNRQMAEKGSYQDVRMPLVDIMAGGLMESDVGVHAVADPPTGNRLVQPEAVRSDVETWSAIGDVRLIRECCPELDELRQQLLSPRSARDAGQKAIARRITPLAAAGGTGTVSSLGKGTLPSSSTISTDPPTNRGAGGSENNSEDLCQGDAESVEVVLRREFYKRMDGRLRELIGVVAVSKPAGEAAAVTAYTKIANVLYPGTPQTVIAVAAHICAGQVGRQRKETGRQGNRAKGETGLESRLNGMAIRNYSKGKSKGNTQRPRPLATAVASRIPD